ncbi:probable calcium-binding protein CML29 [Punica granatum]|uniref:EF-hand domain-containing protein n=2 Tax=Punica granatum TaxID=22663 RepID=A0A218Y016_PUNGR|nr:probable calcium-binding protein CML29 [Punica granatum]OWM90189.1 hypothetical protein CDL15_Pgr006510 [Punica granatum]PKI57343.1 hypothetical protein CRG98_022288 [Punica granatum]
MAQIGSLCSETETLSQVLSLIEAFRAFDGDDDGQITEAELGGILRSLGYSNSSDQDIRAMVEKGDKDHDGLLSLKEFLDMNTADLQLGELAGPLRTSFEALDMNGIEFVTGEELFEEMRNIGAELSLEDCQDIIASMDVDGDGAVGLEDFKLILNSLL